MSHEPGQGPLCEVDKPRGTGTIDAGMADRWPMMYARGLRWIERTERAIVALDHPEQGAMIAIINAIEYQLEIGAHPAVTRHLLMALIDLAAAYGLPLDRIGLHRAADAILNDLRPPGPQTR